MINTTTKKKEKLIGWLVNSRIRTKFVLLSIVPVAGLIYFCTVAVSERVQIALEATQLARTTQLFVHITNLVHEQQKERGISSIFAGSEGAAFKLRLAKQRIETDKKRNILLNYVERLGGIEEDDEFRARLTVLLENLEKLDSHRSDIDNFSITVEEATEYYTHQNALSFSLISYTVRIISDSRAIINILAYVAHLEGKELSGIERALGGSAYSSGKLLSTTRMQLLAVAAAQKIYEKTFKATASETEKLEYDLVMKSTPAKEVERMRNILLDTPEKIREISGEYWFDTTTAKIELLKNAEYILAEQLLEVVQHKKQVTFNEMTAVIIVSIIILALTLFMAVFFSNLISNPLSRMREEILAYENTGEIKDLPVELKEEIGGLARSFQRLLDTITKKTNELSDSERHFNGIFRTVTDGIATINSKGIIQSVNPAIEKLFGYSEDDLLGQNVSILMTEPHSSKHDGYMKHYLETGEKKMLGVTRREFQARRKDGSVFDLELGVNEVRLDKEKLFVGTMYDITQRKQTETEREKLVDKLTDSNEELERFAYVCSHDMQEPMRMVRSFSEMLQIHFGDRIEDDEKGQRYLKFVIDGATRAQNLIADILNYSSLDRDMQKLEMINLTELINAIQESMYVNLEECEGQITHDDLPQVRGNKVQLYQLFQNLINNGLKYRKMDLKPHVHVGVEDTGEHWQFSVEDNGIGMEERHLKKIFEVFRRLHRKEEYAGTGIGLSICKKVIERHNGAIWVESERGKGSTFYCSILKSTNVEAANDPKRKAS